MTPTGPTYRLVAAGGPVAVPSLDPHQQAVVDHPSGPLLVLAGPGTGKTTTLVEAIVDRIERRGASPESVLALTFSRKAADQLRDRVTARLGRTVAGQLSSTFHSFAYGLIRAASPADLYDAPLRLLSAPEQDVVLGELLATSPESVRWPESLRRAAGTRGFAREVAAVLSRAREKGLEPEQLRALGESGRLPEFVAAGWFLEQYLSVLDNQGATDYPDLIRRAVIEAHAQQAQLRARYEHVFVDEYQDTDPGQVALLQALAGDGRNLTVVGDPHQSIYGFRGAEVRGILDFPQVFPQPDGTPAPIHVLRTTRRFGSTLLGTSRAIASRIPLGGSIDARTQAVFARPEPAEGTPPGEVQVFTYDTERAEVERLADLLRRAHLQDGIAWSQMAVLVRSGRTSIPVLRRALSGAGVPIEVASDETVLVREPAIAPLLAALHAVVTPDEVDEEQAAALLASPLVGLDASDVRALARWLRARDSDRPSATQVREAVLDPAVLAEVEDVEVAAVRRARRFAALLAKARESLAAGGTAEEVLWVLWSGTGWSGRLRAAVERGGATAGRAHRDLDALCALFDVAAKAEEQRGHTSVQTFLATLAAQQIPADTLADRGVRGDAVRLLTAHRSKGLEWDLVAVAHVQEGSWPDLRRRASLLQADRIGSARYGQPILVEQTSTRALLAEERRLFYVACTRARRRLIVTAVASPQDDGEQASRFLAETGVEIVHQQGRPARELTLTGVVAELRRTLADPEQPGPLRHAAARRLSALAAQELHGRALVPSADPERWWGTRAWTESHEPVRPGDVPIRLSASTLTALEQCPAKWFLEREARGATGSTQAQGFGNVVHTIAEEVARAGDVPDIDELMRWVDGVWPKLAFRTPWSGSREREQVRIALTKFLTEHTRDNGRTVLGTEEQLRTEVTLPDGQQVLLHGYADRLEIDAHGNVVVIDLKTGKSVPTEAEIAEHPQLGLYQHAVNHGGIDHLEGHSGSSVGAELWQLRTGTVKARVQAQAPQEPDDDGWLPIERQLARAALAVRSEEFPATPGTACKFCSFAQLCPAQTSGTVLS